jgi:hypothetical protein
VASSGNAATVLPMRAPPTQTAFVMGIKRLNFFDFIGLLGLLLVRARIVSRKFSGFGSRASHRTRATAGRRKVFLLSGWIYAIDVSFQCYRFRNFVS